MSHNALQHCKRKVTGDVPLTTQDPGELCASLDVDVVFIANPDEYHAAHAILAIDFRDADVIIKAEQSSKGKVMVGYEAICDRIP